jgi:CRP-like cAMP-binding protein
MKASDLLKQHALFAKLSDDDIDTLAPSTRVKTYKTGQMIIMEGRVGAAFFIIVSGNVEVVKGIASEKPEVLSSMGPGDFFGEIATMKHVTRSASVRALTETQCLVIQRLHFDSYIERFPDLLAKVESALAARF